MVGYKSYRLPGCPRPCFSYTVSNLALGTFQCCFRFFVVSFWFSLTLCDSILFSLFTYSCLNPTLAVLRLFFLSLSYSCCLRHILAVLIFPCLDLNPSKLVIKFIPWSHSSSNPFCLNLTLSTSVLLLSVSLLLFLSHYCSFCLSLTSFVFVLLCVSQSYGLSFSITRSESVLHC